MKKKNTTKSIRKTVRKAVKKHGIATGVVTGAATAMALSGSGATRKMSEMVGSGVASLLKAGGKRNEIVRDLKKRASAALVRAGKSLDPEPATSATSTTTAATDAKVSTTTRRTATPRTTS
jgi:hypothetical protein